MAAEDDSNFFSRWSRRKVQVRTGEALPPEPPAKPAEAPVAAVVVAPPVEPTPDAAPAEPPPSLTLEDVARLTPESDYSAFVARGVSPDVRNAAVKKLFTDPHYNVMDGLDIYIDDYSKPSPLSAAEMAKMVGAQFLKLVDDPNEPKPAAQPTAATPQPDTQETAAQQAEPDAVDDSIADARDPTVSDASEPSHDDHADLQLQPDDVPEPQGSGRRAG
jgi:hypothetical protein